MTLYHFRVSHRKDKKYDAVFNDGHVISFGAIHKDGIPYDQYKDKIGVYSKYDHYDSKRRDNYYKRHGSFDNMKPYTAAWFSAKYLW